MTEDANATLLETLKRLLDIPAADLKVALSLACDAVAAAVHADKVDAFLYDAERDCLVADGSSNQPLSAKQIRHGLDVLPISNGGRSGPPSSGPRMHVRTTAARNSRLGAGSTT